MASFSRIKKCLELSDQEILDAVESREGALALVRHMAKISSPDTGSAKALIVFARMGTSACEWLEGDLRVDVRATTDTTTSIEVTEELGMGMRERVFPTVTFTAPLEEFTRAVERVPERIAPLRVRAKTSKLLSLGVTAEIRQTSVPPPPVKIAEDSFFAEAALRPARAPSIDTVRGPALPLVTPQLPIVSEVRRAMSAPPPERESTRKMKSAAPSRRSSRSMRAAAPAKSVRPPAKSVRPPAKSVRPPAKSVRPPAKSAAKSVRPPALPPLQRPPLPRPKAREAAPSREHAERAAPPLPIVEPALPLVMPDAKSARHKSEAPKKRSVPPKGRPSLESRIAELEIDDTVDSGWDDD